MGRGQHKADSSRLKSLKNSEIMHGFSFGQLGSIRLYMVVWVHMGVAGTRNINRDSSVQYSNSFYVSQNGFKHVGVERTRPCTL